MALRKIYTHNHRQNLISRGFTLIEVIVVIALLLIIINSTLFFTNTQLNRESLISERRQLVSVLLKARANAVNNIDQVPHGVALAPEGLEGYVLFSGENYSHREVSKDVVVQTSRLVVFGSLTPYEIIFEQLSGDSTYSGDIVLYDQTRNGSTSISINYEGKIGW